MSQQTILFLGATGGVTNACLARTLKSGTHHAIAMVRTPDKLIKQLQEQQGLSTAELANLTTLQGNALQLQSVKNALLSSGTLPDIVVTGLGGAPVFTWNIRHPLVFFKLDQPTICQDAARTLVSALREIYSENPALSNRKPDLVFVSTTGVTRGPEDVPFGMRFLYHSILEEPHIDKRGMENVYRGEAELPGGDGVFASVTGIRPTLLAGSGVLSEGIGQKKIKAGIESKPATGFKIQRADVGTWMWENVVSRNAERENGKGWRGEMVSLA